MKLLKLLILSLVLTIFPAISSAQVSLVPQVQEEFQSNYTCTTIIKGFEQVFEFGNFNKQNLTNNGKFVCATRNLHKVFASNNYSQELNCENYDDFDSLLKKRQDANQVREQARIDLKKAEAEKDQVKINQQKNIIQQQTQIILANTVFSENDILGCSIITGRIKFNYIPQFIRYSLELLTILSGVVSLLFVILGGYWYLINGISGGDTDKGKTYITNALIGLALSTSAWAIVNLVQIFFTS